MNKKGFTLIELLAVIVILAIIALIATPIILGVIEKAKKGAAENSALGYIDAVEKQIAINMLDDTKQNITDKTYTVKDLSDLGVSVKGTLPTGNIVVSNGEVIDYILGIDGYVVEEGKAEKVTTTKKYENGYVVYYNPVTGESCVASDAISTTGKKKGCMKWYVFNDTEGALTVNMILDHNTTATVAWNTEGTNGTNVAYEDSNIKPEVDKLVTESGWKSIPRLITANEVAKITGHLTFDSDESGQSWYCLDTNQPDTNHCAKAEGTSAYKWLFDYTNDCKKYGCSKEETSTYGYWTSTPYTGSSSIVWSVRRNGTLNDYSAINAIYGVRPVITVSKSKIS